MERIIKWANDDELQKLIVDNKLLLGLSCDELVKRLNLVEESELEWVIDQCVPSQVIREYLMKYPPSKDSLSWVIRNAQIPLSRKATLFDHLRECEDLPAELCYAAKRCSEREQSDPTWLDWKLESIVHGSFSRQYQDIEEAMQALELEPDEVFTWTWFDFDEDYIETLELDNRPFSSFDEAVEYIRWLVDFEEIDRDRLSWFVLSKWTPDENGKLQQGYRYVLIQDEVIYFEKPQTKDSRMQNSSKRYFGSGLRYRDWPGFPFKNGDLFTIDFRPFAPPVHALMVDDLSRPRENEDFDPRAMIACPDTLRKAMIHIEWDPDHRQCGITPEWSLAGSINFISTENPVRIDYMPYERLDVCTPEELADDETILLEVQQFIREDPRRGPLFVNMAYDCERYFDEAIGDPRTEKGLHDLLTKAATWLEKHGIGNG